MNVYDFLTIVYSLGICWCIWYLRRLSKDKKDKQIKDAKE